MENQEVESGAKMGESGVWHWEERISEQKKNLGRGI